MAVLLHAVPLAGVCRKERSSPVPQVRARPEEMRCVGSKRTPEVGRDMLLAASIAKSSGTLGLEGNCTVVPWLTPPPSRRQAVRRAMDPHGWYDRKASQVWPLLPHQRANVDHVPEREQLRPRE